MAAEATHEDLIILSDVDIFVNFYSTGQGLFMTESYLTVEGAKRQAAHYRKSYRGTKRMTVSLDELENLAE